MRITRDERGNFRVEDEPTRIEGQAAARFLERMAERDRNDERQRSEAAPADSRDRPSR